MKADPFIALEVGEDYIRMGVFARRGAGLLELLDHGETQIEAGPSVAMAREALVATALKRLLDEKRPATREAVLVVDGKSVFSRIVKLPPIPPGKMAQTIRHEAVQNIPFPIDEVVWDSHIADPSAPEPEVLLVAVKAEVVEGLVHAVAANGLSVVRVDVVPVALANAMRQAFPGIVESMLLVEVGRNSSNLVFVDDTRTFFRTVPTGASTMPGLVQETGRSISFYRSQPGAHAPEQILLVGEEVDASGFQERLGLSAGKLELGKFVKFDSSFPVAGHLAVLAGTAAASVSGSAIAIDLLPASERKKRSRQRREPWWLACAATVVLIAAVWVGALHRMALLAGQENAGVSDRIRALEEVENQLKPLEKAIGELEAGRATYQRVVAQRTFWIDVLDDIGSRLPEGMFLLSSNPINEMGTLKGLRIEVVSYLDKEPEGQDVIVMLRDNLRESERFSAGTKVFSRPSKRSFARQFIMDVYFEEDLLK